LQTSTNRLKLIEVFHRTQTLLIIVSEYLKFFKFTSFIYTRSIRRAKSWWELTMQSDWWRM